MEVSSSHQIYVFFMYVLSGALCGAFFDMQRFLRKKYSAGKKRTFLEDAIFVLFCTAFLIAPGYIFDNGEMRYYQMMGTLSGVLFYASLLSKPFTKILDVVFCIFKKILFNPIKKVYSFVLIPIRSFSNAVKKMKSRQKRMLKNFFQHFKKHTNHLKKRMKML